MKTIPVAAALIFRGEELLITQRRAGDHLENMWEFPGGKVEPGETWEGALAREIQEELGVTIRVGGLVEEVAHDYPEKSVRLKFFACELIEGEPRAIACQACKWVRKTNLLENEFPPADANLLERLMRERWPIKS